VDEIADNIYLGTTYNDQNGLFEGDSVVNLHFGMDDKDLFSTVNDVIGLAELKDSILTIHGASLDNLELYFNDIQETNEYINITDFLGITLDDIDQFIGLAESKIENDNYDYVFGVVDDGTVSKGYLAYDSDNDGITMLIEFDDLTAFSSSLIHNNIIVP
jgi:hypothetical protein